MKIFINYTLRDYACVVIFISVLYLIFGHNPVLPISVLLQILILVLLADLLELLVNKFFPRADYPILELLLTYITSITVFIAGWRIFGWYEHFTIWLSLISVALIDITIFMLDYYKDKKDIAFINEQIKQRRDKKK